MSGLERSGNGHMYFSLKDAEAAAGLRTVLARGEAAQVLARGGDGGQVPRRLTLYEARGEFQLIVAASSRRASARCSWRSSSSSSSSGPRASSTRRANGRCRCCRGASAWSRRRPAPRSATSCTSRGRRFPTRSCSGPPVQGEGARAAIAAALRAARRADVDVHHRRARRRLDRGSVGLQRRARGARDRRLPRSGRLRGRPRDRLHDRRLRRRPARADAVGGGGAGGAVAASGGGAPPRCGAAAAARWPGRCAHARSELERAQTRLGDPRRLLDERRQRLDEQVERGRRVLARRLGVARTDLQERRAAPAPRPPAPPHRRAAQRARGDAPPAGHGGAPRAGAPAPRDRGGARKAGGAVPDAGARARLQPHPARRRPRRHQRRRRTARRAHHRARARRRHRRDRRRERVGSGELCSPRTIAGGFGNPSGVPTK